MSKRKPDLFHEAKNTEGPEGKRKRSVNPTVDARVAARKARKAAKRAAKKMLEKNPDEVPQISDMAPSPVPQDIMTATVENEKKPPKTANLCRSMKPGPNHSKSHHPFEADPADHCETPLEAYRDVSGLLVALAKSLGKDPSDLVIYDPYYCNGGVVKRLGSLGFGNVINPCEDFYASVKSGKVPNFDVLFTNPPYSGDHIPRLLEFCATCSKPWVLLVPNYVYAKPYFKSFLPASESTELHQTSAAPGAFRVWDGLGAKQGGVQPPSLFYLIPPKRYTYISPSSVAGDRASTTPTTAPFLTLFICRLPAEVAAAPHLTRWLASLATAEKKKKTTWPLPGAAAAAAAGDVTSRPPTTLVYARDVLALPYHARTEADPLRSSKRPSNKKRKKLKARNGNGWRSL